MAPKRKGASRKPGKPAKDDVKPTEVDVKADDTDVKLVSKEPAKDVEDAKREVNEEEDEEEVNDEPIPKKSKVDDKKKGGRKPKAPAKKATAKKVVKEAEKDSEDVEKDEDVVEEAVSTDTKSQVVVIEASKECNCFKTRAAKVQTGLTKAIPGVEVLINPEKPRKGCFEVRGKDGKIYLSLLGMPRPFTKLKSLDMDKMVEEIVAKVK